MGKRVTVEQKLQVIIDHLTEVIDGGYPGDHVWIGNTMAYVTQNTGEKYDSQLGTITRREMLAWYDRAAAFLEDRPDFHDDVSSALYETEKQRSAG